MRVLQNMTVNTERSIPTEKLEETAGREYRNVKGDRDDEEDLFNAENPLLRAASQNYVPNGGWGWIVTFAAFVIWVR